MHSSISITPIPAESMTIDQPSSDKPVTLFIRTSRPSIYNSWILNNRLRLKNEKLSKRQQSSCCLAFYSLCICVSAGVMIIVIYRFTDQCSLPTNSKQFSIKCLRHWLFLVAICTSLLACAGVLFGACRYFRSERLNFLYDEHVSVLENPNGRSPTTMLSHYSCPSTLLVNRISNKPSGQTRYHEAEHSNTTAASSLVNLTSQRKMPPFNYEELPGETTPIIVSMSPNIDTQNRRILFSSSTSILSSPYFIYALPRTSNATTATINSNRSKAVSMYEDVRPIISTSRDGLNIRERVTLLS